MHERIVIVDAEPIVRQCVVEILKTEGYEVLPTDNADLVVELLAGKPPALVITNVNLPGISGHDAMLKFKEQCPNIPVLMLSGLPDTELIREWEKQDGFAAFPKPFSASQLKAKVREMLGARS